jgi:hypothetical protein
MDLFLRESDNIFPLIAKLLSVPPYKRMYTVHCKTMLEENISNNEYYAIAEFMQDIIQTEVSLDPNANYTVAQFTSNLDNTEGGGGVGPGRQGVYGLSEVMDARSTYLSALTELTATQPTISDITEESNVLPNSKAVLPQKL